MFPIEVELETVHEQAGIETACENAIQNREDIADQTDSTPDQVRDRLERCADIATEQEMIRFDDHLDAAVFACAVHRDYLTSEQASVTSTFTTREQAMIRGGLARMHRLSERVEAALGDHTDNLPVELPSERPFS